MPRSGKVVVVRMLQALGFELGPSRIVNPLLGEHPDMRAVNEEVLGSLGAAWDAPPDPDDDRWGDEARFADLRAEARRIIDRDFGAAERWAWKDPRTTLAVPFWRTVVPGIRYVICVRHPLAVARDLRARDNLAVERSLALWAAYTASALIHVPSRGSRIVVFEDLLSAPVTELNALASAFGAELPAAAETTVARLIDPDLAAPSDPTGTARDQAPGRLLASVLEAYQALATREPADRERATRSLRALRADLDVRRPGGGGWYARLERAERDLRTRVPPGSNVAVADGWLWPTLEIGGLTCVRFSGGEGGAPSDGHAAVREVERLRDRGVEYVAITWPCFWWRETYPELFRYLARDAELVLSNERLLVYRLSPASPA